jgi:hypothetical protein
MALRYVENCTVLMPKRRATRDALALGAIASAK